MVVCRIVKGAVPQRGIQNVGPDAVGHFGAPNPEQLFQGRFGIHIFRFEQRVGGLGGRADVDAVQIRGHGAQNRCAVVAVFVHRIVVLDQIFGEHQPVFVAQPGECSKFVHVAKSSVQDGNQHALAFVKLVVQAFSVDLGNGVVPVGILVSSQAFVGRVQPNGRGRQVRGPQRACGPDVRRQRQHRFPFHHNGVEQAGGAHHAVPHGPNGRDIGRMHGVIGGG